ncbi:unnamed protein product [Gordionus sp. m RMFG-2023]
MKNSIYYIKPTGGHTKQMCMTSLQVIWKQPYSVNMYHELRKEACEFLDLTRDEIIEYVKEPVAPASTNILDWWAKNSDFYPTLSLIAKDYLAQQTSSVPSERGFSKAVYFLTK